MRTVLSFTRHKPPSRGWFMIALLLIVAPALAWAQPRVYEPGDDPKGGTIPGGNSPWSFVTIPMAPAGTVLGDLWVDPAIGVFVWGNAPATDPRRIDPGEGGDPGAGGPAMYSTLYQFNGGVWTEALVANGEVGVAVYGSGTDDVYAATNTASGDPRLYRFDGTRWALQELPEGLTGPASDIAGARGDIYFRTGNAIVRFDGDRWRVAHTGIDPEAHGLVYLGPEEIYAQDCNGQWIFNGRKWNFEPAFDFPHVANTWGFRDEAGELHLYATGCNGGDNGMHVWKYAEGAPGSLSGSWGTPVENPAGAGFAGAGSGSHLWGTCGTDVYAVGTLFGCGCVYHFDGTNWTLLDPMGADMPPALAVAGAGHANVWVSLEDGRLLRFQQRNHRPDVSAARAAARELWPANHALVPLKIVGVVDPDGDPVTIRVTGITMDEPVDGTGDGSTCPDAVIHEDGSASIRAERARPGNGRVYVVTFSATDGFDAPETGYVVVGCPSDAGAACVDDGQLTDATGACLTYSEGAFEPGGEPKLYAEPGAARVEFALSGPQEVRIGMFDLAGRQVGSLDGGLRQAGVHVMRWNDAGVSPGVYFMHVRIGTQVFHRRVTVLR